MTIPARLVNVSPRHGFKFTHIPTVVGGHPYHYESDYALILDCVYEMASDIADANSVSVDAAIDTVLKDESWRILPTQRKAIRNRIAENNRLLESKNA